MQIYGYIGKYVIKGVMKYECFNGTGRESKQAVFYLPPGKTQKPDQYFYICPMVTPPLEIHMEL